VFYAISPRYQGQGFATEAARALADYAFEQLHLKRVVATTDYDNLASIGVMKKLGMRIEQNPYPEPPWMQVVGVIENPTP
jgi:RimJ/RimL family protein N-acetyltransferase